MSFRKIAAIEGCTDATVSLIATGKIHNPLKPKLRGGRKPILSEEEMYTVARYMFLCKFAHLQDGVIFVKKCFNKTITKGQLSSNIRKKLGSERKISFADTPMSGMQLQHCRNDMTLLSKLKRYMVKASGGIEYQWTRWG